MKRYVCRCSIERCLTIGENCLKFQWSSNATTLIDNSNLYQPRDLYIDQNNVVYVLDTGYGRVQRVWPNSTVERTFVNAMAGPVFNRSSYRESLFFRKKSLNAFCYSHWHSR